MMTTLSRSALALLLAPALLSAQAPDSLAARPIPLREALTLAERNALAAVQARGQVRTAESSVRAALGRRELVLPQDAVGGEAEHAADEQGTEEEGESLLLWALHGRSQRDSM